MLIAVLLEFVAILRQLEALTNSQVDQLYLVLDWLTLTRITPGENRSSATFEELSQSVVEVGALVGCGGHIDSGRINYSAVDDGAVASVVNACSARARGSMHLRLTTATDPVVRFMRQSTPDIARI